MRVSTMPHYAPVGFGQDHQRSTLPAYPMITVPPGGTGACGECTAGLGKIGPATYTLVGAIGLLGGGWAAYKATGRTGMTIVGALIGAAVFGAVPAALEEWKQP